MKPSKTFFTSLVGYRHATITKRFTFEASHYLPNYKGKCANLHGHTWTLWVSVDGEVNKQTGMVMDFGDLKQIVEELIIKKLDHAHLNLILPNPTAENIATLIYRTLHAAFVKIGIEIWEVRLAETEGNEVTL